MVTVTKIDNAIDKVIRVSGVRSDTYNDYNGLFRITGVSTHTKFQVATRETVVTQQCVVCLMRFLILEHSPLLVMLRK